MVSGQGPGVGGRWAVTTRTALNQTQVADFKTKEELLLPTDPWPLTTDPCFLKPIILMQMVLVVNAAAREGPEQICDARKARDGVDRRADLIRQVEPLQGPARTDPDLLVDLVTVQLGVPFAFDGVREGVHVINRPGFRVGVNLAQ